MDLLGLTTTDQVRHVLTVSEADLPDEVLQGFGLEDDLAAELEGWLPELDSLTDEKQLRRARLYAKYFCAGTIAVMARVFILKKSTDGSNEGQRSDADGFAALAEELLKQADKHRLALEATLGREPSIRTYSPVSRLIPDRDVITQARTDAPA